MYSKILIILLFYISIIIANDFTNISTSRPGASNPTSAMPQKLFQFELGINSNLENDLTYPILLRYGILKSTEINFFYGGDNINIGILNGDIKLFNNLEQSIFITANLSKDFDSLIQTDLYFPFSMEKSISIWGQTGISYLSALSNKEIIFSYAFAIGNKINKNLNWYAEIFESYQTTFINGGFTYLLNKKSQLDFSTGFSINDEKSKFIEMGFAFRLPK